MKTIIEISDISLQYVPDKFLIPVFDHPLRQERKILDRQKDFDAVAYCISPDYSWDDIQKNEFGKPMLRTQHIGISHSHEQLIVGINHENFGVDIQRVDEKIHRLASKFTNISERNFADNEEMLTLIWSAKESVFKFFGHAVDFSQEMTVSPFQLSDSSFVVQYSGKLHKIEYFRVSFVQINGAYLTLAKPL